MSSLLLRSLFLFLATLLASAEEPAPIQSLDRVRFGEVQTLPPALLENLRARNPQFGLEVFIAFDDQLLPEPGSYAAFCAEHANTPRADLRKKVVGQLKDASAASSKAFKADPEPGLNIYGSYWLVNGVWGLAESEQVLERIAKRDGIRAIYRLPRRQRAGAKPVDKAWLEPAAKPEPDLAADQQARAELSALERGVGLDLIRAPKVWEHHGITGKGVVSVVIDSGVHPDCPDLRRAMWRNPNEQANGKDDDGNGYVDDIFGVNVPRKNGDVVPVAQANRPQIKGPTSHGTIAAGLIAGRGASGVLTGVAPRSEVMACIGTSGLCIDSLQYALEQGADTVSMSFMSEQPYLFRALWRLQAEHASAAGLFLCGGAGNFATQPQYKGKPQIWIPKNIPCVMAGAGLNAAGERAPFSSLGPVDWSKVPGYGELEGADRVRKPDVCTVSQNITGVRFDDGKPQPGPSGNSFSGPQLAGCAALLLEADPNLKPWQLRELMNQTAVDLGEPGWDPKFGWGRLDCLAAVDAAIEQKKKTAATQIAVKEKPDGKRNVVMIMADDVGYECFGCYGSKEYKTPRLDALATGGIRFEHCHSTPLCTPSRVNLMSGKSNVYNYQNFGVYPKDEPAFAQYFKAQGYATAVGGKWQLLLDKGKGGDGDKGITPAAAGFDTHCLWNIPGGGRQRYWDPSLVRDGKLLELEPGSYGPTVVTDFLLEFIRANQEQPFLAYYPMILPHNPFPPTPDSADRDSKDSKQNFIDMVGYIDTCIGRIEDELKRLGLRENTLIVFTGDNGTNAQITSRFLGQPLRGAKGFTRDHGTHVPLIASLPGTIPAGQVSGDLICFSDFFATLVDAAGLPPKEIEHGDGWSFWPQCLGQSEPLSKPRDWIYTYYFPRPYAKKFDDKYSHFEVRFARDKRYKLYDDGRLFDTTADVLEQKPLGNGAAFAAVRERLQAVFEQYPKQGQGVDRAKVKGTRKE